MNPAELKALRKGLGWTQDRMADELAISRVYVGLMERGLKWIERRTELSVRYLADGWRPIESAPKDGSTIDVWRDGTRETVYWGLPPHECGEMGQYCDSDWHSIKKPGWICSTFGEFVGGQYAPFTHWMPLPAGPAVGGE